MARTRTKKRYRKISSKSIKKNLQKNVHELENISLIKNNHVYIRCTIYYDYKDYENKSLFEHKNIFFENCSFIGKPIFDLTWFNMSSFNKCNFSIDMFEPAHLVYNNEIKNCSIEINEFLIRECSFKKDQISFFGKAIKIDMEKELKNFFTSNTGYINEFQIYENCFKKYSKILPSKKWKVINGVKKTT